MPLRPLMRDQTWLMPPSLDELVAKDHPARFVAAMVDEMDRKEWAELGIGIDGDPLGAPAYDPRALLSVWLYGFMTRVRSTRKLESGCRDQMPYLWLTGWQRPDHNTLWRFYQAHRDRMRQLLKRTVRLAVDMGLLNMAVQAVDGTKVTANADKSRSYDREELKKLLEKTEIAIHKLEAENESDTDPAPEYLPEKLAQTENLHSTVKAAMDRLAAEEDRKHINLTDGDAQFVKTRQGIVLGYNAQAMVSPVTETDERSGMIITAADVVTATTDTAQLVPMLEQALENTGEQAWVTLADAGYHSGVNLEVCESREQKIVMPESQDRALSQPYHKDRFTYDQYSDSFICPHGQILPFRRARLNRGKAVREYRVTGKACRVCPAFGTCTKNQQWGRRIEVRPEDAALRRHRAWMQTEEAQTAYRQRKELPEPVFGIIKEQMGVRRLLLRGLANVKAEWSLLATAFNLRTLWKCSLANASKPYLNRVVRENKGSQSVPGQAVLCFLMVRSLLYKTVNIRCY
jgi:transposase